MPLYTLVNDTSPSTTKAAPLLTSLQLEPGQITKVSVQFPRFCGGLAHAQILRGGQVVWPTNAEQDLSSDGLILEWDDDYPVPQVETWSLRTWNDDDTYPHKITAWLNLRAIRRPPSAVEQPSLLQRLQQLVGA
jgi:hypothetical protein